MRFYNMTPDALQMKFEVFPPRKKTHDLQHLSLDKNRKVTRKRNGQYAELNESINDGFQNIANGVHPDEAFSRLDLKMSAWKKGDNKQLIYKSNYMRKKINRYIEEVLKKKYDYENKPLNNRNDTKVTKGH